jgi:murein DD-endopeptidase MepM/ murein hydrolase activator NlpD
MRRLLLVTALLLLSLLVAPPARAAWVWPLHGDVITPYRNGEDPYAAGQHRGIDIAGAVGAPVLAAAGGEVRFAGTAGSSGLTVSVRTGDGFDT